MKIIIADDILTEETKRSFEGPIGYLELSPNIKYGPFYRIDRGEMANEYKKLKNISEPSDLSKVNLSPNVDYIVKFRSKRLIKKLNELGTKNRVNDIERNLAISFIKTHSEQIEMDPKYRLLQQFKLIFSNGEIVKCLEEEWYRLSLSRWCGLKKPDDFMDGHRKYNLAHYFPKEYNKTELKYYLFKFCFYYQSSHLNGAGLFFGKTYGGTEIQYKYNNQAAKCITDLVSLDVFSIKNIRESEK